MQPSCNTGPGSISSAELWFPIQVQCSGVILLSVALAQNSWVPHPMQNERCPEVVCQCILFRVFRVAREEAHWRRCWSGSAMYTNTDNIHDHNPAWQTMLFVSSEGSVVTGVKPVGGRIVFRLHRLPLPVLLCHGSDVVSRGSISH